MPHLETNAPIAQLPANSHDAHSHSIHSTIALVEDRPSFVKIVESKYNHGFCAAASISYEVLSRVNQFRANGTVCGGVYYPPAKPLRWSSKLQQAADKHSQDMAAHNFFNHKSASNGSTLIERLRGVGYNYRSAGENIGAGPATVAQVLDMWVASPAHCVTLMTAHFSELGVGCRSNSNSRYQTYWTLKAAMPM